MIFAIGAAGAAHGESRQDLEVIQLRPHIHLIAGAGDNIVVQTGEDGVVVVGAGDGKSSAAVLDAIRKLSDKPIRYIINTSGHPDEVGGNKELAVAGKQFGQVTTGGLFSGGAMIVAHENVMLRMVNEPSESWPAETFFSRIKTMFLNDEGIEIRSRPAAYSNGDTTVFFRRSDVIVTGQLIDATRFPTIDIEHGGSVQGLLQALNDLIWEAIPQVPLAWRDGGTLVVPARGRVYERDDVVQYRDMVTIVRDRVQAMIDRGMTKAQVVAANPAKGYTTWFGTDKTWTSNMFVDAIYTSLSDKKP
jgi:glyoxylase-like metal-dependent hydrolase (beta-lactamase superfamily II)